MAIKRQHQNSFQSGVLSPNTLGRSDTTLYANGLIEGKNIVVDPIGGITRRAGTRFIRNFGTTEYVRIFPFTFNKDQAYLIVMHIVDATTTVIDIYRDDLLVSENIVVPYSTAKQIKEIDIAQSADIMVMTQGDTAPSMLRRLGDDATWDFIPIPIVNPPLYDPNETGTPDTPLWDEINGYPKHCTFHQGRLWFAGTFIRPQSVWSSVVQDFFNFALGTGDSADSIQESLDTDFINPITSIFSARTLQVFTNGGEFFNDHQGTLTPLSSSWSRQTNYGSAFFIPPLVVDGASLYVDATGRTIRNFIYSDGEGGYDAPSISSQAEHLVKEPQRLGALRGNLTRSYNLVYVINADGTMAVLTMSKAYQTLAWTEWITQGSYRDIAVVERDAYILVQRLIQPVGEYVFHNGQQVTHNGEFVWTGDNPDALASVWLLERIDESILVDSASTKESITETSDFTFSKGSDNFFGTYTDPDGYGYVFIVRSGILVYSSEDIVKDPLKPYVSDSGVRFSAGDIFSYNNDVREMYVDEELSYLWEMYTLISVQTVDVGTNYIDNLGHLIGLEVSSVLDGNVQAPQVVVAGDTVVTVERSYPDGNNWRYAPTDQVVETSYDAVLSDTTITYDGVDYLNPTLTEYGYLIAGVSGEPDSEYLEKGVVRDSSTEPHVDILTASGTYTPPNNITKGSRCMVGGGGSGARHIFGAINGGGVSGNVVSGAITFIAGVGVPYVIGVGGVSTPVGQNSHGFAGSQTSFNSVVANGGAGGNYDSGIYWGLEASRTTCGGTANDGAQNVVNRGGQSSGFANGGDGGLDDANGGTGGVGSGGGGATIGVSGAGGRGEVRVSLGTKETNTSEVRKMKLIAVAVEGGVITFPTATYKHAQAGLYFPVRVKTMPIMTGTNKGNYGNEPKRIVSITSRYVNTQGVEVNGVSVPEREFGERTLDEAPPLLSGLDKNRHLGYNRDTSVTISQDDPMPFTLLSIDIEINQ